MQKYLETDWNSVADGPFCYLHHDYYICDHCGKKYGPFERGLEHPYIRVEGGITWCIKCGLEKLLDITSFKKEELWNT